MVGPSFSSIGAITAGATLLQGANGLLQALLPLRIQAEGLSITAIGVVATAYGFGFAAGCFLAPLLIRHVGHIRAFVSLAAIAAVVALAFSVAEALLVWCLLRGLSGMTLAGLFTVIDGWVSAQATSTHRGRILSVYMICTKLALMISPLGLGLGSVAADGLFMAIAAMMCLSLLPLSATTTREPAPPSTVRVDVPALFRVAPSAAIGAFIVGLVNGPVVAVASVFGVTIGLSTEQAAGLLFAMQAGSLLMQWPLGWLSDHTDRRYVIGGLAAGTALISAFILWASAQDSPYLVIGAFALWGGTALCIYSVCIAHACDLVEPNQIVPTVSSLLVCWAAGVTLGPIPGAAMMDWVGPQGLFIYAGVMALVLTAFIGVRILSLRRAPARGGFVDLSPTSAATANLRLREDLPAEDKAA
jgi:MFS family permease